MPPATWVTNILLTGSLLKFLQNTWITVVKLCFPFSSSSYMNIKHIPVAKNTTTSVYAIKYQSLDGLFSIIQMLLP